jgi:FkbM family methyltransferase
MIPALRNLRRTVAQSLTERRALALYRSFMGTGDLCFDVGANVGHRTAVFRKLGARVIAVEPQDSCLQHLHARFDSDTHVTIVGKALGERAGFGELSVCDDDPAISTMSKHWREQGRFAATAQWKRKERVELSTLSDLIGKHGVPAFCKIDVEGGERTVLAGLDRPLPAISFEFTREFLNHARECIRLLESLGPIEINVSVGESMRLVGRWDSPATILSTVERRAEPDLWGDIYVRSASKKWAQ